MLWFLLNNTPSKLEKFGLSGCTFIEFKDMQPQNTPLPINVALFGIVIEFRAVQP
jgi:hypothetical protein